MRASPTPAQTPPPTTDHTGIFNSGGQIPLLRGGLALMEEMCLVALGAVASLLTAVHDSTADAKTRYDAARALRAIGVNVSSTSIAARTDDAPTGT